MVGGGRPKGPAPRISILAYTTPPLFVVLGEDDRVNALQLGYANDVRVDGYEFLGFRYLSLDEIERLGRPSSTIRDEASERQLLSTAPEGAKIEYYVHSYFAIPVS